MIVLFLYNISLSVYNFGIHFFSFFNSKAKKFIRGRQNWQNNIENSLKANEKRIWIHCASTGEYEQAKPIIEALYVKYTEYKIVITFFSPSGYEAQKQNHKNGYVFYLPIDRKKNAEYFISIIKPSLVLFIKYEFWYYYLNELKKNKIPTLLISTAFRREQPFFKWYGRFFRQMLSCFTCFFVQDTESSQLLKEIGFDKNVILSGDTRYDRVTNIAIQTKNIPIIERFKGKNKLLIGGSTWPDDENMLYNCKNILPSNWKMIIAPHEFGNGHIDKILKLFGNEAILYSSITETINFTDIKILIIDNMGMLSSIYYYCDIAFVGGGFLKGGIHNILEPAVYGLPIFFGPNYKKFVEANALVAENFAFPIHNAIEFNKKLELFLIDEPKLIELHECLKEFMQQKIGATKIIIEYINEYFLL